MSKKIEEIIALHNEALDAGVKEAFYLEQKIKTRCRQTIGQPSLLDSLNLRFAKVIITYTFLFFILVFANLFLIRSFDDKGNNAAAGSEIDIFMAAVPGSVTAAYTEVSRWEK
jgi:hypothetical protein